MAQFGVLPAVAHIALEDSLLDGVEHPHVRFPVLTGPVGHCQGRQTSREDIGPVVGERKPDKWEQRRTEAVIEEFEREPDPAIRLKKILEAGFELGPTDRAEIALLANPDHPAAVRAVRRVAERRITYIAEQLEKLGWDSADALDCAVLMYYVYVGYLQMAHVTPQLISDGARRRHLELVFDVFAAGELPASQPLAHG